MNNALSLLLAITVGALLPLQVAMNMQLRTVVSRPGGRCAARTSWSALRCSSA